MAGARQIDVPTLSPRATPPFYIVRSALCLATVVAVVLGGSGAAVVQAATTSPLPASVKALLGLKSFEVTSAAGSSGVQAASLQQTVIAVRKGGVMQFDIVSQTRPAGAGETTIAEDVIIGSKVCERVGFNALPRDKFVCKIASKEAAALTSATMPIGNFMPQGAAITTTFKRTTARLLHNNTCDAYTFVATSKSARATGTLYLAHTTFRPCEQKSTTVGSPIIGLGTSPSPRGTATTRSVSIWSHFNDPALAIPRVPGS